MPWNGIRILVNIIKDSKIYCFFKYLSTVYFWNQKNNSYDLEYSGFKYIRIQALSIFPEDLQTYYI